MPESSPTSEAKKKQDQILGLGVLLYFFMAVAGIMVSGSHVEREGTLTGTTPEILLWSLLSVVPCCWLLAICLRKLHQQFTGGQLALFGFVFLICNPGWIGLINTVADPWPAEEHTVRVFRKVRWGGGGKSKFRYLQVQDWDHPGGLVRLKLGNRDFDTDVPNPRIKLTVKPGAFGFRWIQQWEPVVK